jgi:hypothetical protein
MPRTKTEAADYIRTVVRLPKDVHAAMEQEAQEEDRSLNAQLVRVLKEHCKAKGRTPLQILEDRLRQEGPQ